MHTAPLAAWNSLISAKPGEWWLATPGSREKVGLRCPMCHRAFILDMPAGRTSMWDTNPRMAVDEHGVVVVRARTLDGVTSDQATVRCPKTDCCWEDELLLVNWSAPASAPKFEPDRPSVDQAGNTLRASWTR